MSGRIGVLGGTFDPIHMGHLSAARAAQAALGLDVVRFIPSSVPPHRTDRPRASGYHRLQMTALAVAGSPSWQASEAELEHDGPSYTFDTLTRFQRAEPRSRFFFIIGADAFAEVATWHRYPDVLGLAHFVVIARTGTSFDRLRTRLPHLAARMLAADTLTSDQCLAAAFPSIFLVSAETPDISSTEIRRRAATGEPLDGMVPDEVARYIRQHHLYV
ncbi:MAG: nicotinate-nucleotide adenylyltransferase [Acidobacteriota bacterium]|nr:nicotinate-nucleotide adenylyltransferase [Acidobacteriota bacterium]